MRKRPVRKTTDAATEPPVKKVGRKKTDLNRVVQPEELAPDGTLLLQMEIAGRAATKKTHQQIAYTKKGPVIVQSKTYKQYEKLCKIPMLAAWANQGKEPMDFGISITMRVWLNDWQIGDHTGYMQSIGDILEAHNVIANDMFIHWDSKPGEHWFGGKDKENPRITIEIRRMRHPYEEFRAEKEALETRREAKRASKPKVEGDIPPDW